VPVSCATFQGFESDEFLGFPVGWFYFVRSDHADVVRLLSDAQDLPVILADLDTRTDPPPRWARSPECYRARRSRRTPDLWRGPERSGLRL
jgi:hypothetical protein